MNVSELEWLAMESREDGRAWRRLMHMLENASLVGFTKVEHVLEHMRNEERKIADKLGDCPQGDAPPPSATSLANAILG
jgi:hypothetical protein